jgi:endoglucanase
LNSIKSTFDGDINKAMEFEHQWRLHYVDEQAIEDIKNLGFNSVRVPFNYNLFWHNGQLSDHGFQYFDRLISYCRDRGVYILLDMHAAPGYQNPGDHSDNNDSNADQPRDSVKFWDGANVNIASQVWRHIASRYKDETIIWGYDLINEPVPQQGREYELLGSLVTMRNAIREVDNKHIIVAEGSWWAADMQKLDWMDPATQTHSGINYRWDNNLVYQTHHYVNTVNAIALLNGRKAITDKLNIPLMLGEYGETTEVVIKAMTDWSIENNVSYFPWSFKKISHHKTLWTVYTNDIYDRVKTFINDGGSLPDNAYAGMLNYVQNNVANGSAGIEFHQGFYDAVKLTSPPVPSPKDPVTQAAH